MRVGAADLPLHYGSCPKWLFPKMVELSKGIAQIIVEEYGKEEFLKRISNPYFFQALGCLLGYDWHSSGLTTTTTAALKEALQQLDLGIVVLGGKGKASRKVPEEIESLADKFSFTTQKIERLKYTSRMVAKVDNAAVQDGYTLYHHAFFVTEDGKWAVVQQGMNASNRYARRYHWLSSKVVSFVNEPHAAIVGKKEEQVLDLTSKENQEVQKASVDLVKENPSNLKKYFSFGIWRYFKMPEQHTFSLDAYKKLMDLHEFNPSNFEELLALKGVGPKTVRALALLSKLVYGTEISWKDPVKYTFAHGGKDRIPYPVDKKVYDETIKNLREILEGTGIGKDALKRLEKLEI